MKRRKSIQPVKLSDEFLCPLCGARVQGQAYAQERDAGFEFSCANENCKFNPIVTLNVEEAAKEAVSRY